MSRLPWRVKRINDDPKNRLGNIVDADGKIVCTFYGRLYDVRSGEEIERLAAILAIAPELLALAQEIDNAAYKVPIGLKMRAAELVRRSREVTP